MKIKKLNKEEYKEAFELCLEVFSEFEAPYYSPEGTECFHNALKDPTYINELTIYGAYYNNKIIGILATRNKGLHIALFFVKKMFHKKGIGRMLFEIAQKDAPDNYMTVLSAPYAINIYKHLGFTETGEETNSDGVIYTPMKYINCRDGK